jgi:hypothetical protein
MKVDHLTFVDVASLRRIERTIVVKELECAYKVFGASGHSFSFTLSDLSWNRPLQERLQSPGCAAKADRLRSQGKRPEEHVTRVFDSLYKLAKGSGLSILLAAEAAGGHSCKPSLALCSSICCP